MHALNSDCCQHFKLQVTIYNYLALKPHSGLPCLLTQTYCPDCRCATPATSRIWFHRLCCQVSVDQFVRRELSWCTRYLSAGGCYSDISLKSLKGRV